MAGKSPKVPAWLAQFRRIEAAVQDGRALAPEDGKALLAAMRASASARADGADRSIEEFLGWPHDWRSTKRLIDRNEFLQACIADGHVGRPGAREVIENRRARLIEVCGGRLPAEEYLAKLLNSKD